jgi:hypothetical protein
LYNYSKRYAQKRQIRIGLNLQLSYQRGRQLDPLEALERIEKMSEQREKRKIRKHITYLALTLSIVWIILGLIDYLRTGNTFLLASSSTTSGPVLIIMGFYFGDQLLQRYIHRGS